MFSSRWLYRAKRFNLESEVVVVADIAFVAVVGGGGLRLEVIRQARQVRRGQTGEHFSRETA